MDREVWGGATSPQGHKELDMTEHVHTHTHRKLNYCSVLINLYITLMILNYSLIRLNVCMYFNWLREFEHMKHRRLFSLPVSSRNFYLFFKVHQFSSVQFSCSVVSDSLQPHELQHTRPPCPSPTPGVHPNSCPSSRWCHPVISSSVVPVSSCPQSLPASESFPMSQLFTWGGQRTGVSAWASVLPKNTQHWSPLKGTGWISLQSKRPSRVFSNTTVQNHQFFGTQLSSQSNSHIHTWPLEKP